MVSALPKYEPNKIILHQVMAPVVATSSASSWYVLNYIGGSSHETAQKAVDRFNTKAQKDLEIFAPTYVIKDDSDGEIRFKTVRLTFHYVFVRGAFQDIKELCGQPNGFSFLLSRGSAERYATVDDRAMANFQNIARAYKNCLPYLSLEDIDLEEGDLVEVVKGDFPGLVGTYIPTPRSKSGNIVLNIYNNVGTIAFNVKASDIRILEFSRKSTRANDQLDAFLPHLLSALRYYYRGEPLPASLAAKLSVFVGRMGVAKLPSRKLDARLQMLLYASNQIIGNAAEANRAYTKYEQIKDSITNVWTQAAHTLITSVLNNDKSLLAQTYRELHQIENPSKLQQFTICEYGYYMLSLP